VVDLGDEIVARPPGRRRQVSTTAGARRGGEGSPSCRATRAGGTVGEAGHRLSERVEIDLTLLVERRHDRHPESAEVEVGGGGHGLRMRDPKGKEKF
jgi:hypothetical protein